MSVKKLKMPGIGNIEVDLQASEFAKEGKLYVTKLSEKFYAVKHRTYHEPTDMQIIAAIRERDGMEADEVRHKKRLTDQSKNGKDPIAGHIGL